MSVLIIAEAGVNHNGNIELAYRLIDNAVSAGADIVKFQTFTADSLATPKAPKAAYQNQTTGDVESQYQMLKRLELSRDMHELLIEHCRVSGIRFLSTGFDIASVDLLVELGQNFFKIPSGEITNLPYLRHIGGYAKPIILSTGMATLGEIETALEVLQKSGTHIDLISVLHCNTEYPTPMQDVNLLAMRTIKNAFGVSVGYSDHTKGIEVPIAAVAIGATIIEKHFTLDCTLPGPDHKASLEPKEFKEMVKAIRNIEMALGDGRKYPTTSEVKNKNIARKSLVASAPIRAGEKLTINNLTVKRPGTGISPMRWDEFLGKNASRAYAINELIEE